MQSLKRFVTFLSTWYGALVAAAGTLFPFASAFFNVLKIPSPDRDMTAVAASIIGATIVAAIFLTIGNDTSRKTTTTNERRVISAIIVFAFIMFLIYFWLQNRNLIEITHGNDERKYYFIRGDEDRLTPIFRADWAEGQNASYPNYLKTLGYSSFADGEVFQHEFVSWMRVVFLLIFSAMWGALTALFTFFGAVAFRASEYDSRKRTGSKRTERSSEASTLPGENQAPSTDPPTV